MTAEIAFRRPAVSVSRSHIQRVAVMLAAALAAAGIGVAGYLTAVHFADQPIVCNGLGDCEYVNNSEYAKLAGVPVALAGVLAYTSILVLSAGYLLRSDLRILAVAWCVAGAAFAFSMYLTYVELWVLDAICVWCVASATILTLLFAILSVAALAASEEE